MFFIIILIALLVGALLYFIYKGHIEMPFRRTLNVFLQNLTTFFEELISAKKIYSLTEKGVHKPFDALCQCLSSCTNFCNEIKNLQTQHPSSNILKIFIDFLTMTHGDNINNFSDSNYNCFIVQYGNHINNLNIHLLYKDILNAIYKDVYEINADNTIPVENLKNNKFPLRLSVEKKIKCENCQNELLFHENGLSLKMGVPFKHEINDFTLQNLINKYFEMVELENFECSSGNCVNSVCKLSRFVKEFPKTICIDINIIHWNGKSFKESRKKLSFSDNLILKQQFLYNDLTSNQSINDQKYSLKSMIAINDTQEIVTTRLWNGKWYQIINGNVSIANDRRGLIPTLLFYELISGV